MSKITFSVIVYAPCLNKTTIKPNKKQMISSADTFFWMTRYFIVFCPKTWNILIVRLNCIPNSLSSQRYLTKRLLSASSSSAIILDGNSPAGVNLMSYLFSLHLILKRDWIPKRNWDWKCFLLASDTKELELETIDRLLSAFLSPFHPYVAPG